MKVQWLAAAFLLSALCTGPGRAEAIPSKVEGIEARTQVQVIVDRALEILQSDASLDVKRQEIERIADRHFAFETIAKLSLARNWRKFSPEERKSFVEKFRTFLARRYGYQLDQYSGDRVEIVGVREEPRGDWTILTHLNRPTGENFRVDYRMRRKGDEAWKVIDVTIEGVSLVSSFRSQFQSILKTGTPGDLLQQLEAKNVDAKNE